MIFFWKKTQILKFQGLNNFFVTLAQDDNKVPVQKMGLKEKNLILFFKFILYVFSASVNIYSLGCYLSDDTKTKKGSLRQHSIGFSGDSV